LIRQVLRLEGQGGEKREQQKAFGHGPD
jgi:hypothetical protein